MHFAGDLSMIGKLVSVESVEPHIWGLNGRIA